MAFRLHGLCAAALFVFSPALTAQLTIAITSTPAALTLGSDTIVFPGNIAPLMTTISPSASTPLATAAVTFTASPATVPDAAHPLGFFHGIVSQTFTVNGVSATMNRVVDVFAGAGPHSYFVQSSPVTFNFPQGSLTFSSFSSFG